MADTLPSTGSTDCLLHLVASGTHGGGMLQSYPLLCLSLKCRAYFWELSDGVEHRDHVYLVQLYMI